MKYFKEAGMTLVKLSKDWNAIRISEAQTTNRANQTCLNFRV